MQFSLYNNKQDTAMFLTNDSLAEIATSLNKTNSFEVNIIMFITAAIIIAFTVIIIIIYVITIIIL